MNNFQMVKEKLNIRSVIEQETGLKFKRHHLESCPFCGGHDCFSSNADEGYYKCFQCDKKGDVFNFLSDYHGIGNKEALHRASEYAGISLSTSPIKTPHFTVTEKILLDAADYYHQNVINGGSDYFIERRRHSEKSLQKLKVGWSDGNLAKFLLSKGYAEKEIIASGLAKIHEDRLVDFFCPGLAIFPHFFKNKVLHFTQKDPRKIKKYQLPGKNRSKEWLFYNQDALHQSKDIIVVEGEHDLLSLVDAGISSVIGLIGQPSEEQVSALRKQCRGKRLYLWLDGDEGGRKQTRWIYRRLMETDYTVRILVHPGDTKDPDEYLKLIPEGQSSRALKDLFYESLTPLMWEIKEAEKHETIEDRLEELRSNDVFRSLATTLDSEKLVYIEYLKYLGLTEKAIIYEMDLSRELKAEIQEYFALVQNRRDADPNWIADLCFSFFNQYGRFFCDNSGSIMLLYEHHIYEVGNNRPFNALMKKMTGLLPVNQLGRSLWESLASDGYNYGKRIEIFSWIHTDRSTDHIYVNLNLPDNMILKMSSQGITRIPNGLNRDSILLKSSPKIHSLNFIPDCAKDEGLKALKELIFDNLTCEREQRYLIICWMISVFLVDFTPYVALMKFSGRSQSGKSTAAGFISFLLYGSLNLKLISSAAAYSASTQSPLLIIDNLESEDIKRGILNFLLLSATRGGKEKRKMGTETDTTEEQTKALVLITAIEPFTKAELINRTFDIEFSDIYKNDNFLEDDVTHQILQKRDIIVSSLLKLITEDILPHLNERKDYISILKKEFKNHSKSRTDEFLSLLMLILSRVLASIPYYEPEHPLSGVSTGEREIYKAWIEYQNAHAKETEVTSNSILKLLDGLVKEYLFIMKDREPVLHEDYDGKVVIYEHPEYHLEMIKTVPRVQVDENGEPYTFMYVDFIATSWEIVMAFDRFCRNFGLRNPYSKASVFGQRLKNDEKTLNRGGWELIAKDNKRYYKTVRGQNYLKFRKTIAR